MSEQNSKPYPGTAAVLSFVLNGLGQIYNGEIIKGLVLVFFSFIGISVLIITAIPIVFSFFGKQPFGKDLFCNSVLFLAALVFVCALCVYSIFDAYRVALNPKNCDKK